MYNEKVTINVERVIGDIKDYFYEGHFDVRTFGLVDIYEWIDQYGNDHPELEEQVQFILDTIKEDLKDEEFDGSSFI